MGFDAFGLPSAHAAIQRGIHPPTWTYANFDRMRAGFKAMGTMFDWERIVGAAPENQTDDLYGCCEPGSSRWWTMSNARLAMIFGRFRYALTSPTIDGLPNAARNP